MQIFKFQRWVAGFPCFSRPAARMPRRACSQSTFHEKKRKRKREICTFRLKGKMANWKLACGKESLFSRRVKQESKKASAPWRLTGNVQSVILYPRYIKTRNLIPCYTCVAHLLLGCLLQKKWFYVEEQLIKWPTHLPEGIACPIPPAVGRFLKERGWVSLVTRRSRRGQSWTLPWAVTSPRDTRRERQGTRLGMGYF